MTQPTTEHYGGFEAAFGWFNEHLFEGQLPRVLFAMWRKSAAAGNFTAARWRTTGADLACDEIALNPDHLDRPAEDVLSTVVHEMVHCWQHHHGKAGRRGYHNKQWADRMEGLGLIPSSTAQPGGVRTGERIGHYVVDGPFREHAHELLANGWRVPYVATPPGKGPAKVAYSCGCGKLWGKAGLNPVCGDCGYLMTPLGAAKATSTSEVEDLQATVARLEAEHANCLPLLARADDLRRRAAAIEGRAT